MNVAQLFNSLVLSPNIKAIKPRLPESTLRHPGGEIQSAVGCDAVFTPLANRIF